MLYLFDHWQEIKRQIQNYEKIFIFSDYDGTLTPIQSTPALAIQTESMKKLLAAIIKDPCYDLAIVTGRTIKEIRKLINLKQIYYIGNHGLEIRGKNITFTHPEAKKTISP